MKICPYCSEEIQDSAKKCRYCGEWFEKKDAPVIKQSSNGKEKDGEEGINKKITTKKGKMTSKKNLIEIEYQENKVNRWTYKGRLGMRNFYKMFIISGYCFGIILLPIVLLLAWLGVSENTLMIVICILSSIYSVYFLGFIVNRRLKDRGKNLWYLIFCLIPIVGQIYLIYLMILIRLVPGNEGENYYGKETDDYLFIKKRWSSRKRLASIIIYIVVTLSLGTIVTYLEKDNWQLVYYPNGISQDYEGPFYFNDYKSCEEKAYIVKSAGWDVTCSFKCKKFGEDMQKCKRVIRSWETENGEIFDFVKKIYDDYYTGLWQVIYYPKGIDEAFEYGYGSYYSNYEKCKSDALKSKENHIDAACIQGCNIEDGGMICDKIIRTRRTEYGERFKELEQDGRVNRDQENIEKGLQENLETEELEMVEERDGAIDSPSTTVYCTKCEENRKRLGL